MAIETIEAPTRTYATRPLPWLHRGTDVSTAPTAAEALKLGGLDWETKTGPLFNEQGQEIPQFRNIYRGDTGETLGVGGRLFSPINNVTSFDFLDGLVADRVLRYAGTGSFNGGVTCWMQAYLDESVRILDDEYRRFLVAKNNHDAKGAFGVYSGNLRVICANTLAAATSVAALVKVSHIGDVASKLAKAQLTLQAVTEQQNRMADWLTALGTVKMSDRQVGTVQKAMFGSLDEDTPTRRRQAIELFQQIYEEERAAQGANAYSLAQAVTGFSDHGIKTKEGGDRLESALDGSIFLTKRKGLAAVAEVARTPLVLK